MDNFALEREDDYDEVHLLQNATILEHLRSGVQPPSHSSFSFKELTWTWRIP